MVLTPQDGVRISGDGALEMVHKMRRGDRLGAVAPANGVAVRCFRPDGERRNQQHQQTPGAQRSAESGKGRDVEPRASIKTAC